MDHDRLFKELLQTFFVEFLQLFLPEVVEYLDRDSIEFLDKEVFTDVTAGERHEVDLLVKARFRGRETCFLIHVENQSFAGEAFAERMFRYFARLYEKYRLPVYPVALLSYDAPLRPEPDAFQIAFPDRAVLAFQFRAIQLNRLNWRDYVRRPNPVAAALMSKMRIALADRPRVQLECLRLIATLKLDRARQTLIRGFVDAYLRLSDAERVEYNRALETIDPPEREAVMQVVNEWEEIGEERGLRKGQAALILRQLRRRFGETSTSLPERINQLPLEKIEALSEAMLDFTSPDDAEGWLAKNS